jgi:hypothetical protein
MVLSGKPETYRSRGASIPRRGFAPCLLSAKLLLADLPARAVFLLI